MRVAERIPFLGYAYLVSWQSALFPTPRGHAPLISTTFAACDAICQIKRSGQFAALRPTMVLNHGDNVGVSSCCAIAASASSDRMRPDRPAPVSQDRCLERASKPLNSGSSRFGYASMAAIHANCHVSAGHRDD